MTAAMEMLGGSDIASECRKPEIMSDAAYVMLTRDSKNYTGNFAIDEEVLKEEGCRDFEQYACVPGAKLMPDFFLDEFHEYVPEKKGTTHKENSGGGAAGAGVKAVFDKIGSKLNEDLVKKTNAVFAFDVQGI